MTMTTTPTNLHNNDTTPSVAEVLRAAERRVEHLPRRQQRLNAEERAKIDAADRAAMARWDAKSTEEQDAWWTEMFGS